MPKSMKRNKKRAKIKIKIQKVYTVKHLLVKLIGVNKGRRVTLKYFSILIKVSRKHRLFIDL